MNRYELLKENEDVIFQFVKNGILSYKIIRDMEIFESYLQLQEDLTQELKFVLLGEEFGLSHKTIEPIIYTMKNEIR
jgi:hypothetical protein